MEDETLTALRRVLEESAANFLNQLSTPLIVDFDWNPGQEVHETRRSTDQIVKVHCQQKSSGGTDDDYLEIILETGPFLQKQQPQDENKANSDSTTLNGESSVSSNNNAKDDNASPELIPQPEKESTPPETESSQSSSATSEDSQKSGTNSEESIEGERPGRRRSARIVDIEKKKRRSQSGVKHIVWPEELDRLDRENERKRRALERSTRRPSQKKYVRPPETIPTALELKMAEYARLKVILGDRRSYRWRLDKELSNLADKMTDIRNEVDSLTEMKAADPEEGWTEEKQKLKKNWLAMRENPRVDSSLDESSTD